MGTQISTSDARAVKVFSAALFTRMARTASFSRKLTGSAPQQADAEAKLRHETSPDMPVVEIRDLTKGPGDRVTVDLIDIANGKPVMGDKKIAGRLMDLDLATDELVINQARGGIDPGGRMSQQRTRHDLRKLALANLTGWNVTLKDNLVHVHLAGARGYQTGRDWNVPLASDPDFASVCVNTVSAPTFNRRYIPGSGNGVTSDIGDTDKLTLTAIDNLRTIIDESEFPMQGIRLPDDPAGDEEDPLYVMYVSPRQWNQLQVDTSTQNWRTFLANAHERASVTKHPLFNGQNKGMWRGILIKQLRRAIRVTSGSTIKEYASAGATSETDGTASVDFDRAIVLGAQALACAYGRNSKSGYFINWHEEETDHGNVVEVSTSIMQGHKKLTFTLDGTKFDHGVWVVDTYAPAVT